MYSHLYWYKDDCFTLFVKVSIVFRPLVLKKCLHMLHVFLKDGFHWAGDTKQIEGMDQLSMRKHLQNILMKLLNIPFRVQGDFILGFPKILWSIWHQTPRVWNSFLYNFVWLKASYDTFFSWTQVYHDLFFDI